jgi:hypothetical protein
MALVNPTVEKPVDTAITLTKMATLTQWVSAYSIFGRHFERFFPLYPVAVYFAANME